MAKTKKTEREKMERQRFLRTLKQCSILYVEDDREIREYITEFLNRFCKTVYEAENAEVAEELYRRNHPEVILLDINLPGSKSGIEFCETIRQKDTKTRIIMSTAYTDREFLLKVVELGLTRYLVKPMTSEDLFGALEKAMDELSNIDAFFGEVDLGEGFFYHPKTKRLRRGEETIPLRRKEMEILEYFIAHPDETVSYEQLESSIWGRGTMTPDAIRSQIRNLRKKTHPGILENISGVGYRLSGKNA